jgi:hypothetical protein
MNKKQKDVRGHMSSENNFIKVDLHIHTPASTCYKGNKDDEEYLRILESANKKDIKILAITDHNSIRGYKRLAEIKNKLVEEKTTLSAITDSAEATRKLLDINKKLSVFKELLLLPGVEFEVSNGIHLLVVFNETTEIDRIEKFLRDGGYNEETFGKEEPNLRSKWDIFRLYEESKSYDCIVIDAHTDSEKGIWKTIPSGRTRADCFRDPQLNAVSFKNEKQRENIIRILNTSEEYKRNTPLAFVRFSDAHNHTEVGLLVTWAKLEKIDFTSLKTAFANPAELISTESPSVDKILNSLITKETTFGIPDLSDENIKRCKELICAMNNSVGGHLLFGVTQEMSKVGLPSPEKDRAGFHKTVKQILESFDTIEGLLLRKGYREFNLYPLQNNKIILSVYVPRGNQLATIKGDGCIYTLRQKDITILSGPEVQTILEERTAKTIEIRIGKWVSEIKKSCFLAENLFASMPIIRKFETMSVPIPFPSEVVESIKLSGKEIEKLRSVRDNGKSRGNVLYLKEGYSPRLKDAYLRYSVPLFNIKSFGNKTVNRETIYIVPGGGVFYSKYNYPFLGEVGLPILKLFAGKKSLYTLKFMVAYLKSSFLLWYVLNKLDEINLYLPNIYKNIRLPKLNSDIKENIEKVKKIEERVSEILKLEREYLVASQNMKGDSLNKFTKEHNSKVDPLAYTIDQFVYQMVELSKEEIGIVEKRLRLSDIYLPEEKKIESDNAR